MNQSTKTTIFRSGNLKGLVFLSPDHWFELETGIGGVKSPKIKGGGEILNFEGPLKLTHFYRDSLENRLFGGQKSKPSRGNCRVRFDPHPGHWFEVISRTIHVM